MICSLTTTTNSKKILRASCNIYACTCLGMEGKRGQSMFFSVRGHGHFSWRPPSRSSESVSDSFPPHPRWFAKLTELLLLLFAFCVRIIWSLVCPGHEKKLTSCRISVHLGESGMLKIFFQTLSVMHRLSLVFKIIFFLIDFLRQRGKESKEKKNGKKK